MYINRHAKMTSPAIFLITLTFQSQKQPDLPFLSVSTHCL